MSLGHLSNVVYDTNPLATKVASYVWTFAWIAQFIGHGKVRSRWKGLWEIYDRGGAERLSSGSLKVARQHCLRASCNPSCSPLVPLLLSLPSRWTHVCSAFQVFFVFLEVAFFLGYRPELHKRIQNNIGVRVAEYRRSKAEAERAKKTT